MGNKGIHRPQLGTQLWAKLEFLFPYPSHPQGSFTLRVNFDFFFSLFTLVSNTFDLLLLTFME